MDNNYMDKLVQGALKDIEVSYRPEDWDLMNARLDEERKTTSKLIFYKSLEILVVLVAVWSIFQFGQFNSTYNNNTPDTEKAITPTFESEYKSLENKNDKITPNETLDPSLNKANSKPEKVKVTPKAQYNKPIAKAELPFVDPISVTVDNFSTPVEAPIAQTVAKPTVVFNDVMHHRIPTTNVTSSEPVAKTTATTISKQVPTNAVTVKETSNSNNTPVVNQQVEELSTLPRKVPDIVWNNNLDLNDELPTYNSGDPLPKLKKHRPFNIRAFFSPDMNTKKDNNSMGFAAGALVSKELTDRVQIGTGLSYNYKQFNYVPGEFTAVATNPMQLMGIMQNQIEVPLVLEFTIKESVNWRPFFVVGASGNFVLHTKYDYDLINYQGLPSEIEFEYPDDTKGLLNGGNFKTNSYYTADFGIGLERKLDNNLHLFIQPTFKYALTGIGPNDDKINTFSLVMGARATL